MLYSKYIYTFYEEPFESFDPVVDIGMVCVISKYLFITAYIYIYGFRASSLFISGKIIPYSGNF